MILSSNQALRICTTCKSELPLAEFHAQKNGRFGKAAICKRCNYEKNARNARYKKASGKFVCITCSAMKDADEFRVARNMPNGIRSKCKDCEKIWEKKRDGKLSKNPIKAIMVAWRWECYRKRNGSTRVPEYTQSDFERLLFAQEYRCALTGDVLTGANVSIDHKIPLSRGGTHDIENLQLCTIKANEMKHDLTMDEFVEACKKMVVHQETVATGVVASEHVRSVLEAQGIGAGCRH